MDGITGSESHRLISVEAEIERISLNKYIEKAFKNSLNAS